MGVINRDTNAWLRTQTPRFDRHFHQWKMDYYTLGYVELTGYNEKGFCCYCGMRRGDRLYMDRTRTEEHWFPPRTRWHHPIR